jgi:hypothetical protein
MRANKIVVVCLGLFLALCVPAHGQDQPPEQKAPTPAAGGAQPAATGDASPSPDEIIEQMSGGQKQDSNQGKVEAGSNPALLEEGSFEAGRDIFQGIFNQDAKEGPTADGLPGMRIEEINLSGIMSGAFGTIALFLGKDKEVYAARVNQKFANGRLSEIHKDKVVFEQEVIDEFGKQRPPVIKEVPLYTNPKKKGRG